MIEIKLFGAIEVDRDGKRVAGFRSVKTRVLLAYLVVQARPLTRSFLAGMLWPDVPESAALGHLRRALHNLNKLLPDLLEIERKTVLFRPKSPPQIDIIQFSQLAANFETQKAALALATAPFLEGIYLADAPEMETWIVGEQERWRQQIVSLLEQVSRHDAQDDLQSALYYARQWVQADPWEEIAHRHLMLLLAQVGRKQAAVEQFSHCEAILQEELGIGVSAETEALYVAICAGEHDPVISAVTTAVNQRGRGQNILRDKVKTFWLDGVMHGSLSEIDLIPITRQLKPTAVANPWQHILHPLANQLTPIADTQRIDQTFAKSAQALLILGEPGAGKTIVLLELLDHLYKHTKVHVNEPIPVVFNLSSWQKGTLFAWLVAELNEKYLIPQRDGRRWLENNHLTLLLDGLDEVQAEQRNQCVQAINQFRFAFGLTQIVVCCRINAYESLADKLQLTTAIVLQALSTQQITAALAKDSPLHAALTQDETLHTLAQSPLMLSILQATYQQPTQATVDLSSPIAMRKRVFSNYITRMFERRGQATFTRADTVSWLGWLARHLNQEQQTIFLIEQLQPRALASGQQEQWYRLSSRLLVTLLLAFSTVLPVLRLYDWFDKLTHRVPPPLPNFYLSLTLQLLLGSLVVGLLLAVVAWWQTLPAQVQGQKYRSPFLRIATSLAFMLLIALTYMLMFAVGNGLSGVFTFIQYNGQAQLLLIAAIVFGWRGFGRNTVNDIHTVEALGWSGRRAAIGAIIGAITAIPIFFLVWGDLVTGRNLFATLIAWGFVDGLLLGGLTRQVVAQQTRPNHGMWLSLRHALLAGSGIGLLMGMIGEWFNYVIPLAGGSASFTLGTAFVSGIYAFASAAFWFGAIDLIYHAVLRFMLWRQGAMPAKYAHFLDYAAQLSFLRKVGGGYIFAHNLLQVHFENLPIETQVKPSRWRGTVPMVGLSLLLIVLLLFRVLPAKPVPVVSFANVDLLQKADGVDCELTSGLSLISAELTFTNTSRMPVGLYFKAYTGAEWPQTSTPILPNTVFHVPTQIGHAFCVRDATTGLPLSAFTITQPQQSIDFP